MTQIQQFELDVVDDHSVLLRIVATCHQRGCRVVSLHYDRAGYAGHIALGVQGESSRVGRLGPWLSNLVHVLSVREHR
jgi:acetolactate synthase regulatory subunit